MKLKATFGLLIAVGAGIAAFFTEIDNQKRNKEFEDMKQRISNLEKGTL